jgi:hypothetical protein
MKQPFKILQLVILLLPAGGVISPLYSEGRERDGSSGCGSYLVIRCETNLNSFSFTYNGPAAGVANAAGVNIPRDGSEILIPVKQFHASNPHMYNDFLAHLQEHIYPYITIRINDLGTVKTAEQTIPAVQKVLITLAGVTRQYAIECEKIACGDKYIIKGIETLRLTDFDISPPEKLNGLIKVRNEITVSFGIMLNFTGENSYAISK